MYVLILQLSTMMKVATIAYEQFDHCSSHDRHQLVNTVACSADEPHSRFQSIERLWLN
jgi:hypothetical protein